MKKFVSFVLCLSLFLSLFSNVIRVSAKDEYIGTTIAESGLRVRSGAGTSYKQLALLPLGTLVNLVDNVKVNDQGGCSDGWYRIYYATNKIGYVCSSYLEVELKPEENTDGIPKTEYEKELQELGFPNTYWASLSALHEKYPNWQFEAIDTGLLWSSAVIAESVLGKSLIQTSNPGYKSTAAGSYNYETDTFKVFEGSNWYAASNEVVAYYMDPRNFLNEKQIFMFEKLSYDASYQTTDAIKAVFGSSSYLNNYVNDFVNAGRTYNINPIYLASRVRQETGLSVGAATSGAQFTYNGKTYRGLYNLYNIGATTGSNPVLKGLVWANGGASGTSTSFGRPWTTISKSIMGGADFLESGYIGEGQYTSYLQRFNVDPDASSPAYTHQYMTNIMAVASEAASSYSSYKKMNLLNSNFVFAIPVYENMGEISKLPDPGNPNNHLKSLKVNGSSVIGFEHDTYTYNYAVSENSTIASVVATPINSSAKVTGAGEIKLTGDTTTVTLKVTAENGKIQEYKVNIIKTEGASLSVEDVVAQAPVKSNGSYLSGINVGTSISSLQATFNKVSNVAQTTVKDKNGKVKTSGSLVTGDTVTIVNGNSSKTYTMVVYGDNDGDGKISIVDLLKVQKQILGYTRMNGAYLEASDVDKDNKVTIVDLLKVQKHILGYSQISQ